jgi:hypothetical protein
VIFPSIAHVEEFSPGRILLDNLSGPLTLKLGGRDEGQEKGKEREGSKNPDGGGVSKRHGP